MIHFLNNEPKNDKLTAKFRTDIDVGRLHWVLRTLLSGTSFLMFNFLKLFKKNKVGGSNSPLLEYKDSCDHLVTKYEGLLKKISEYMQDNQLALKLLDQKIEPVGMTFTSQFQLNTFHLMNIKKELIHITQECEGLLQRGADFFAKSPQQEKSVEILVTQLKELHKYSGQIEDALEEFEDKLMRMEEVLAENSLRN